MNGVCRAISQTGATTGTGPGLELRLGNTTQAGGKTDGAGIACFTTGPADHILPGQTGMTDDGDLLPRGLCGRPRQGAAFAGSETFTTKSAASGGTTRREIGFRKPPLPLDQQATWANTGTLIATAAQIEKALFANRPWRTEGFSLTRALGTQKGTAGKFHFLYLFGKTRLAHGRDREDALTDGRNHPLNTHIPLTGYITHLKMNDLILENQ